MKKTTTIPIGPQHPALIEPEYLKLSVDGETVVDVEVNLGYIHRGIEGLMQKKTYQQNVFLAERVCGICSGSHTVAYSQTIENLMGIAAPDRARYIRTIILELERLHSHLLWAGVAGYELGIDTVFMNIWKDREYVMELLEEITGNRVNYGMSCVGGVRRDISNDALKKTTKIMDVVEERANHYLKVFASDNIIRKRTIGIGKLSYSDASDLCAVGPTARSAGVNYDVRKEGFASYGDVDWNVVTDKGCDVFARVVVRLKETLESVSIIRQCVDKIPKGDISIKAPINVPANEAVGRVEAPRGELFYYARSNGTGNPERVKIRTPTYANILSLKPMLAGCELADVPIIVASIDPCFACTDRVTLIDLNNDNMTRTVDKTFFRRLGMNRNSYS